MDDPLSNQGDGLYLKTTRKYELLNTLGWEMGQSFWHRFSLPKEDELTTRGDPVEALIPDHKSRESRLTDEDAGYNFCNL
jgi:hypothetical protein